MAGGIDIKHFLSALLVLLCLCGAGQGDSLLFRHGQHYRLGLENGETVSGFVIEETPGYVTLEQRPKLTHTEVRKRSIVSIERVSLRESLVEDVMGENPHADSYLLCGTAFTFQPQEVSTTGHWFIFDNIQYAFSSNWAINVSSLTFYPCGLGLKFSYQLDESNYLGGSFNGVAQLGGNDLSSDLLGYFGQARFTHGSSNRNFTIGAGFVGLNPELLGIYSSNRLLINIPVLSAGFCNRFASRWSVVLDGFLLPDEGLMFGGCGFRFLRDEYSCWNFGLYSIINDHYNPALSGFRSFYFPLPYFSYSRKMN